jgi:predicted metal-dependent phosphotriesterase family hydrolase
MKRRTFIQNLTIGLLPELLALRNRLGAATKEVSSVNTVLGPKSPRSLGMTLMHEHVLVDFIGADKVNRDRYSTEEVFRTALPYLKKLRESGCRTLVECTPAFLGRDAGLLKRLSQAARLHIIASTGFYGAANDRYVPAFAYQESADQLAARWVREFSEGIEGTGIRPGIIKIGVDKGRLSEIDAKLVRAAAKTHAQTGLTIASHTGDGTAAMEELEILRQQGLHSSAFIWVHAQSETDVDLHFKAAKQGAWVEFDGISESSADTHLSLVKGMIDSGFLTYTLISQDAGWYHVGESGGGSYRPYSFIFESFIPMLKKAGVLEEEIRTLLLDNPRRALTLGTKKL